MARLCKDLNDKNVPSAVLTHTRGVAKQMALRGTGNIIVVSSMASDDGIPNVIGYSASKAAAKSMTRAMAVERSRRDVGANCIAPGSI